ncbi:RusA family crossover junction endodeoxyribonuclease [Candidatus Pacearchaeota archaeon]|nr:RusA family crossover junction endodeoxyribonuclease [Candidatus Pacearchaeota archaeon]
MSTLFDHENKEYDFELVIQGPPQAWQRAGARIVTIKHNKKQFISFYTKKETRDAEMKIAVIAKRVSPPKLLTVALRVDLFFYLPRPKGHYGTGRNAGKVKPQFLYAHPIPKPDYDNFSKLVLDALTKVFWADDSIICQSWTEKTYSSNPRTEIKIKLLN